jgi:hypothetical protein
MKARPRIARVVGSRLGLPGYAWDTRLHNYVSLETGRMVARAKIHQLLRDVTQDCATTLGKLGEAVARGQITPRQFYEAAQITLKHLHNANAALAVGGWDRMTATEWGRNGGILQSEYRHLAEFTRQIAAGELTEKQIIARAQTYADSGFSRYWELDRNIQIRNGSKEERLVTVGDERVCPICLETEASEWQPIGTIAIPQHVGCRCGLQYR